MMKRNVRADDGELGFDLRYLESGDVVEVFDDGERAWRRARFEISTAGVAAIRFPNGEEIPFDAALRAGLRRIVN
jgi:hypothetical protein